MRPFTVALRGLVYGRFGTDGESPRLPIMYLGYSGLVRGYDPTSFDAGECGVSPMDRARRSIAWPEAAWR